MWCRKQDGSRWVPLADRLHFQHHRNGRRCSGADTPRR